jgi:hypothetical protein
VLPRTPRKTVDTVRNAASKSGTQPGFGGLAQVARHRFAETLRASVILKSQEGIHLVEAYRQKPAPAAGRIQIESAARGPRHDLHRIGVDEGERGSLK